MERLGEGLRADARGLLEHGRRHRRGCETEHLVAGPSPTTPCRLERPGLARPGRSDEEGDLLATGEEPPHGRRLVLAQHAAGEHVTGEHGLDDLAGDDGDPGTDALSGRLEHGGLPAQRARRREAHRPVALELGHLVSPSQRRRGLGGKRGGEGDDLGVAQHLLRERLHELADASGVWTRDEPGALLDDV